VILILLLQTTDGSVLTQLLPYGPTVIMLALVLWTVIRLSPMWKELRLRELDVREQESLSKGEQASALNRLADVVKDIAVEQRRATENIEIMQRVNADSNERLAHNVHSLMERLDTVEQLHNREALSLTQELEARVVKLEGKHVGSESTATGAQ
jgi:Mg/Co/Ni transporter MgtE